jgi:hypothetical protein
MSKVTKWLQPARFDPGLVLACILALFVILPLLQPGLPGSADTPIHFYRALEFARSWAPGVIYPRWAPDLAYGYGYPLWDFAPPLPYILPLAFHALGLSLEISLKLFIMLAALGYALGAYLFVRDRLGPGAGLVAAAIYIWAPFALREVLLYGGNYPQYLAIGLYPWLLWALGRLYRRDGLFNLVLVGACYGAVILSHLFHALILTPVAIVYAATLWLSQPGPLRRLGTTVLGLGLGLLGTAFFWLPALFERAFTRALEKVYLNVSPISLRFLDGRQLLALPQALDARAANPWVPFSLGPAILALAGLGVLAWWLDAWRDRSRRPAPATPSGHRPGNQPAGRPAFHYQALFFLGLLGACIFMVLPASNWLWTHAPFLAVAEFPWRWLGLASLSLAFLGASVARWATPPRQHALALGAVLVVLSGSAVYFYPAHPFVRYSESVADMAHYELASQTLGTTTLGGYLPGWVSNVPDTSPLAPALTQGRPVDKLDPASLPTGTAVEMLGHSPISDNYRFHGLEPFQARFFAFFFPGWSARLDGRAVDISIEPGSGLISVPVPAGSHELQLRFGDTPLRTAANVITGLTATGLMLVGLWRVARRSAPGSQLPTLTASWAGRPALLVGGVLVGLLACKVWLVDPHTGWFRRSSPPRQVSGVQHALQVNLGDQVWLLGYDVDRSHVAKGGALRVVLYWQAQHPLATNYRSFVHLDAPGDQRTWAGNDNFQPGQVTAQIELPTSTWDTLHYVRDEHLLRVPSQVPPAAFDLRVGLYDPDTGQRLPILDGEGGHAGTSDTLTLQQVQVTAGRAMPLADVPNRVSYRLGERFQLLGYDWNPAASELSLYWQTIRGTTTSPEREVDYVVFVHLLDDRGRLAWGSDGPPLGGLYPTSQWQAGEIVVDPRPLSASDLPPGPYRLAVGMYDPATLVRLPVRDGHGQLVAGDAIPLTRLNWP